MSSILLLVWEAADWPLLQARIAQGGLPHLAQLQRRGVSGPLTTFSPYLSCSAMTTLATGKVAADHGILAALEKQDGAETPVSSHSVHSPFIWQIAAQRGLTAGALNWPLTYPVTETAATVISEPFFRPALQGADLAPPPPASVAPVQWREALDELRLHAADIEPAELLAFVPDAAAIDQNQDHRLALLAVKLAETITTQNTAVWCLQQQSWDLLAVRFSALDAVGQVFARFLSPRRPWVDEADFTRYAGVVNAFYDVLDLMLGYLLELAGPATTVLLVSPYGMRYGDHLHPDPQHTRDIYRDQGFLCATGPQLEPAQGLLGASLLDIAPSVLRLCGLQEGLDMRGRPLYEVFNLTRQRSTIASWDSSVVKPTCAADPKVLAALFAEQQLLAGNKQPNLPLERALARAASLAETGRPADALQALTPWREAAADSPDYFRLFTHLTLNSRADADIPALITDLMRSGGSDFDQQLLLARLYSQQDQHDQALDSLFKSLAHSPQHPTLHVFIGEEYHCLQRYDEALKAFDNALSYDPENVPAQLGRAAVFLAQGDYQAAADAALAAIAGRFNEARAHLLLGRALEGLSHWQLAADAYNASLSYAPGSIEAHRALARLYDTDRLNQPDRCAVHQTRVAQLAATAALAQR